jgi:phosphoadenosine phosphosulfate reductase
MIGYGQLVDRYGALDGADLIRPLVREAFPGRIALVSSFGAESAVLLHMVSQVDPETPVIFLDTDKLFPETLAYRDTLVARLGLTDVRAIRPLAGDVRSLDPRGTLNETNPDLCCRFRKVEPLERALRGFQAWITGRKQYQGAGRAALPTIETADWRIKVNPLATWNPLRIEAYLAAHDLPRHPLVAVGFPSIGCAPCTAPVTGDAKDPRAGRWAGLDKTECGIHWTANGKPIRVPVQDGQSPGT